MYTIHFVSGDLCTCCGPVCLHVLRTCLCRDTHSYTKRESVTGSARVRECVSTEHRVCTGVFKTGFCLGGRKERS